VCFLLTKTYMDVGYPEVGSLIPDYPSSSNSVQPIADLEAALSPQISCEKGLHYFRLSDHVSLIEKLATLDPSIMAELLRVSCPNS